MNNPISLCDPSGKTPVSIRDFVESHGGVARYSYYGFAFYELNDIGLVVGDKPLFDYAIDFYIENGVFMAEDYDLAYYFKVDNWATYFPGFRWYDGSIGDEDDEGFEVETIEKFSNKDFCLDFANCIIDIAGVNGRYLGRDARGIAMECYHMLC